MDEKIKAGEERMRAIRAAEARKAYHRAWRASNKQKVKEYNKRYWEKKGEEMKGAKNNE